MLPGHHEQLSDHPGALANELLHQLGAGNADERALCVVGYSPREQGLAGAGGTVEL